MTKIKTDCKYVYYIIKVFNDIDIINCIKPILIPEFIISLVKNIFSNMCITCSNTVKILFLDWQFWHAYNSLGSLKDVFLNSYTPAAEIKRDKFVLVVSMYFL